MNLPCCREKHRDIVLSEKLGCSVGTVEHADFPFLHVSGNKRARNFCAGSRAAIWLAEPQHVARAKRATAVAAEFAEGKSRAAPEIARRLESPLNREISAKTPPAHGAHLECVARRDGKRSPAWAGIPVVLSLKVRPAKGDHCARIKAQRGAGHHDLKSGGGFGIAEQAIRKAMGEGIHRPRGRHSDGPETRPPGIVLHSCLCAPFEYVDRARRVRKIAEKSGGDFADRKLRRRDDLQQVIQIALDAADRRGTEGGDEARNRRGTIRRLHDDLREHRIVKRSDFCSGLHPCLAAGAFVKRDFSEQSAARLKILMRVLGIDAHLNGMTARRGRVCIEERRIARGEADHPLNKIDAGDLFRHAVLHLQTCVHFEKIERAALRIEDKLDCAGRPILDSAAHLDRRRAKLRALCVA